MALLSKADTGRSDVVSHPVSPAPVMGPDGDVQTQERRSLLALSIKQPWASLIAWGAKDIENRTWPTKYTGIIAIHASAKLDPREMQDACDMMRGFIPKFSSRRFQMEAFPAGAILGTVELAVCVITSDSPWFVGEYGFLLKNAVKFKTPIPCKGALGFWKVSGDIVAAMRAECTLSSDAPGARSGVNT
jgi:hypothetical protein